MSRGEALRGLPELLGLDLAVDPAIENLGDGRGPQLGEGDTECVGDDRTGMRGRGLPPSPAPRGWVGLNDERERPHRPRRRGRDPHRRADARSTPDADFAAVDELDLESAPARSSGCSGPTARQDDHGGDAHHARHPDLGHARRGRDRRHRPPGPRQAADRRGLPAEHARPAAHRVGEPLLPRPPVRHGAAESRRTADELLEQFHLAQWAQGVGVRALRAGWRSG